MTAPLIWIYIPLGFALVLYFLRRWERVSYTVGVSLMVSLAALAWLIPVDQPIQLGIPGVQPFRILESAPILGYTFTITLASQPFLIVVFLGMSMWFGGAYLAKSDRLFIPLATAVSGFLTASFAIQPKSLAVVLVEMVALLCVPILAPPGKPIGRGVLRFLVFQTLGMMFVLIADWMLHSYFMTPENAQLLPTASLFLGLGFALMGAIFPFHTWIPMLAREAHPYAAAFVFFLLPAALSFLGLDYLRSLGDLEITSFIYFAVRLAGILMVISGGLGALFDRHLVRIMGFAGIVQIGMGLLAISLIGILEHNSPLAGLFFAQLFPQLVGFSIWALSLSTLRLKVPELIFRNVQGIAHSMPLTIASLTLASFSIASVPLLASFPGNLMLWSALAEDHLAYAILSLLGNVFLFAAALRSATVFVMSPEQTSWKINERGFQPILLAAGVAILIIIGLIPQQFLPLLTNLASIFIYQGP